ncbi:MAG: nucleotidyltransferase domain-containing protein [Candidatus Methylumidiphilus sp.]
MPRLELKRLQLPPRYLAMVLDIVQEYLPEAEIWAYGSRVMGGCYEASDLDLVVRNPQDFTIPTDNMVDVKDAFMESDLPIQVQIVDWARIPKPFYNEIEAGYVVIKQGQGGSDAQCSPPEAERNAAPPTRITPGQA